MNTVKLLHRKAMQYLDDALVAENNGDRAGALDARLEAYRSEKEATEIVLALEHSEPTRSIIAKSAATIALSCGLNDEAESLAIKLLGGTAPEDIADEARDILEQIWFMRHLELRGVELANDELQISLAGKGIGYGFAPTTEVVQRLDATNVLMLRTAERRSGKHYRDAGPPTNFIRNMAQQYISVPRAASFAVTIRIGRGEQLGFDGIGSGEGVIDEMLDCIELFNAGNTEALTHRIDDGDYLRNFLALAQGLVPDGEVIKTVGFTAVRSGTRRLVALRRTWDESKDLVFSDLGSKKPLRDGGPTVDVTGWLRYADSLRRKGKIKVQGEHGTTTIGVSEGMMNDIVQPHWNRWVTARVRKTRSGLILDAIRSATQ